MFDDAKNESTARDTLLNYYSTECTVHGGYVIALAIGIFTFFQLNGDIWQSLKSPYPEAVISLVSGAFVVAAGYLLARLIFWGSLASLALHTCEISEVTAEKLLDKDLDTNNPLMRLHLACVKRFKGAHRKLTFLAGAERALVAHLLLYLGLMLAASGSVYAVFFKLL